ncbi:MAG: serine hydroxymethyltransferase [Alphaproteobacteria bacterium]|nr:serine hydroxymethyltransferase [Alphaproteobacteria bacterium]MBN2779926.1 serine hydroxymethyltransferase [Alphaproteobacteria bacterium]
MTILDLIQKETQRQQKAINLIASENFVSDAVLSAQGSVLTNKYAEGYPYARYYQGCEFVDAIESNAIEKAKKLFGCNFANVQPHSGANANLSVFLATVKPGDTVLGMNLKSGGHLSHGAGPNLSGKWFNAVSYDVNPKTFRLDYDAIKALAQEHQPKLIIAGGSAYPFQIDFKAFRDIADSVGATLLADISHIAGLIAGGAHPSPFPYAHLVSTTTHKTLRGPRAGMILTNDEALAKKINSAVFPGSQGGPLMHVIAAKAIALEEALHPSFKDYATQIIKNAKALAAALIERGLTLSGGGTETHLMLVDLRPLGLTGDIVADTLEKAGIVCNKNGIPFDDAPPTRPSGIRLGTPAMTTRGYTEEDFKKVGNMIADVIFDLKENA